MKAWFLVHKFIEHEKKVLFQPGDIHVLVIAIIFYYEYTVKNPRY